MVLWVLWGARAATLGVGDGEGGRRWAAGLGRGGEGGDGGGGDEEREVGLGAARVDDEEVLRRRVVEEREWERGRDEWEAWMEVVLAAVVQAGFLVVCTGFVLAMFLVVTANGGQ